MAAERIPSTAAMRLLRETDAVFTTHVFDYERFPGAVGAAQFLGVDPHLTAKTIVFTTNTGEGVVALMHGDLEVSTKKLARTLRVKSTRPATERESGRFTGYQFGGTSPLGMSQDLPVVAHVSLAELDKIYVNGGSRGFLVGIGPKALIDLTGAVVADVAID